MKNIAFIIFSPDATTTGIYKEAIKKISEFDVDFFNCNWVKITKGELRKIYSENYKSSLFDSNLVETLFSLDYSLVCLVKSTSVPNLVNFLRDFKGSSNPLNCDNNKLRNILGAESKILNFIHTSDSIDDVLKEAEIFFSSLKQKDFGIPPEPKDLGRIQSISIWDTKTRLREDLVKSFDIIDSVLEETFRKIRNISVKTKKTSLDLDLITMLEAEQNAYILGKHLPQFPIHLFKELGNLNLDIDSEIIKKIKTFCPDISQWDKLIINCYKSFLDATRE